jgi:hypothetical protein
MNAHCEAVPICLKTMAKTWLHDALASFDFVQESVNIGDDIIIDFAHMNTENCRQKYSSEPGHRVDR